MATKFYILPYSQHSHGAIMLADELDGKRIKLQNSNYNYNPSHVLINWGNGNCPYPQALNAKVCDVINKVDFFKKLIACSSVPKFAFTQGTAADLSFPVVCRTTVEGADGQGIVIADTAAQLVPAQLYTEYVDKTSEYRVHLGRNPTGEVIIIARQKKFKSDSFTGDGRIWTGPETKLEIINTVPQAVAEAAWDVFDRFPQLTFGAFDIVYNNSEEKAYVLEINSAPMLTAQTTKAYADFFRLFESTTTTSTETSTVQTTQPTPTTPQAASTTTGLFGFVKAQLAAGHITANQIAAYTPQPTEEQLIQNYVNAISS